MPDHASRRESNVNALEASLLASPILLAFSSYILDNGIFEQKLSRLKADGVTVARQPVIHTRFLINSPRGET